MGSGFGQFRWDYLIFALLILIDLLVAWRVVQRFMLREGQISPDAPFFLLILMILQVAIIFLFAEWKRILKQHQRLKDSFEYELELSRQIMENDEASITVVSSDGFYTYANRATCEMLGLPREQIVGRSSYEFMVEPSGEKLEELLKQSLTQPTYVPVTLRRASGDLVNITVRVAPRWHGNRIVGAITYGLPGQHVEANQAAQLPASK